MSDRNLLKRATAKCISTALDDAGAAVNCWRLRSESDKAYAWRLAIHVQESILLREEMLEHILSLSRHTACDPKGKP